jgi:D-alanyl-D-alanine carboxypeptidase
MLALGTSATWGVSSAGEPGQSAQTAGLDAARYAALNEVVSAALRRTKIPGALVGVWQEGRQPYLRAFGVANTTTREPMQTDFHMRIGSLTKSFTVQAILQLVRGGKVALDDPIGKYVNGVPRGNVITLRQLAAMRSGLNDYSPEVFPNLYKHPHRVWMPQELLDIAFSKPMRFRPGTEFDYNNTNTVLLGLVVEKASGMPLHRFIRKRITEPLGLRHTLLPTGASIPFPHPTGYTNWTPGERVVDATNWRPSSGWAAGAMVSNLRDVGAWARALAKGRLITPELQRERERFLPAEAEGHDAKYGLAIELHSSGWKGHNGNLPGFMTYPYYLPATRMTVVMMINANTNVLGSWFMFSSIIRTVAPDHPWPEPPQE